MYKFVFIENKLYIVDLSKSGADDPDSKHPFFDAKELLTELNQAFTQAYTNHKPSAVHVVNDSSTDT